METLSVIIPVYNSTACLERCIASITAVNECANTVLVHEIILVDDGSTDGSSELCDQSAVTLSSEDLAIRVIHQANRGVSAARNAGLHAANGTFVFFVDSDDTVDSKMLADLIQTIRGDTSVDLAVYGL